MVKLRRALVSVSNKEGIIDFVSRLKKFNIEIISTGGTAKILRDNSIATKDVSEYTGFPEMMDGRVKTLHPKIHGGLLGKRDMDDHVRSMEEFGILPIDMVVINLYQFEKAILNKDKTMDEIIEEIDIGGPAMIRSAAKNHKWVAVVVDPSQYNQVISELEKNDCSLTEEFRFRLACEAFARTAEYDRAISGYLYKKVTGKEDKFSSELCLQFRKIEELRYGENPHQKAAIYGNIKKESPSLSSAVKLHGKELSYNNYLDTNGAVGLLMEFEEIACVIIKHNNPCGVATANEMKDAFTKARETDPVSAFGGIVGFNRKVDEETARELSGIFLEVIIAPGFDGKALEILTSKKNLRLVELKEIGERNIYKFDFEYRSIFGGLLVQERDLAHIDIDKLKIVSRRQPSKEEMKALLFAWKVAKHVKSNAIVLTNESQTIGIGAGQMSRVDSCELAIKKAKLSTEGAVLASDAFFPFRDGIDVASKAGVSAVIQPGGSVRDDEVIAAVNEYNIAMVFTGIRHFKH